MEYGYQWVQLGMVVLVVNFFRIFESKLFWFVVAIFDLVHDVEAVFHHPNVLTASGNLYCDMSDARKTAAELAVSRASLIFQKRFPNAISS